MSDHADAVSGINPHDCDCQECSASARYCLPFTLTSKPTRFHPFSSRKRVACLHPCAVSLQRRGLISKVIVGSLRCVLDFTIRFFEWRYDHRACFDTHVWCESTAVWAQGSTIDSQRSRISVDGALSLRTRTDPSFTLKIFLSTTPASDCFIITLERFVVVVPSTP
jgi:hypothetical protein